MRKVRKGRQENEVVVLKFHVLHSYYPLGSLESIVNLVQPTLATEAMGVGTFTLNIMRVNGSVAIDTGIVQASVTQMFFYQNPVSIFAVSKVLLPIEIFGKEALGATRSGNAGVSARRSDRVQPLLAYKELSLLLSQLYSIVLME
uniref:Fasciclin-like arabinogalactan protein 4 n=1 Tax=Nelumbo nucifera TaxID=4432 RepID=A0A822YW76_NELNU|nr:TPA_asm: hypothetical protein HUJ06_007411 [Nelumbo nucifera]